MRPRVNLPRWESIHLDLELRYVDPGFYDDITEKVDEGYVVIEVEGYDPYLLMIHEGVICEVGRVERNKERENLGNGFVEVYPEEVKDALRQNQGLVNVYRLPERVCMNICKIINNEPLYGDLNTEITSIERVLSKLKNDEFSGMVAFTNTSNYGYIEMRMGRFTDFWFKGDRDVESIDDIVDTDFEDLELNIFSRQDVESVGEPVSDRKVEFDEPVSDTPDYSSIAEVLSSHLSGLVGGETYYQNLDKLVGEQDDIVVNDGEIEVQDKDREVVFYVLKRGLEESSSMVPLNKMKEKISDDLSQINGGNEFLEYLG